MGRKRTKAEPGDRVVHTSTGETGTITNVHTETKPKGSPPNYTVLRDTGPRRTVLWEGHETEWHAPAGNTCKRCGDVGHTPVQCPYGSLGHHLTAEGRTALLDLGLDPRRAPGKVDGEDAYEGVTLTVIGADRHNQRALRQQLRRRVCEVDGVVVDGHSMIDGTCEHCGGKE